jgi:hypothetical protein
MSPCTLRPRLLRVWLGLGLVLANVRFRSVLGTLQASGQIGPRAKRLTGISGQGKLSLSMISWYYQLLIIIAFAWITPGWRLGVAGVLILYLYFLYVSFQ